ncbi:hypothetical protein BpHYR1_037027 [Brachionus plicatilis]|uniref:Uncharacterized protein n=1 Tax=Brachionus plicatilis TaxID=10195 RepID=A0A3M7SM98_BRAPC|nr:hypothetical protein BpHYR1_037027 [Brachionus plicatilis]
MNFCMTLSLGEFFFPLTQKPIAFPECGRLMKNDRGVKTSRRVYPRFNVVNFLSSTLPQLFLSPLFLYEELKKRKSRGRVEEQKLNKLRLLTKSTKIRIKHILIDFSFRDIGMKKKRGRKAQAKEWFTFADFTLRCNKNS